MEEAPEGAQEVDTAEETDHEDDIAEGHHEVDMVIEDDLITVVAMGLTQDQVNSAHVITIQEVPFIHQ